MNNWKKQKHQPRPTRAMIDALYGTTDITKPKPLPDITIDNLFDPPNSTQDGTKQNSRHNTRLDKDKRLETKSTRNEISVGTKSTRTAEPKPKRKSSAGQSEWKIQASMVAWFGRNFRDQRDLLCANNNNSQNRIAGARNNMIGIRSGRSDLTLYWSGRAYHIEVKTPTGTQSESQREFQRLVESNGFTYHIVRSKDEFIELIRFITGRDCSHDTAEL
jgi:hypothetical protein